MVEYRDRNGAPITPSKKQDLEGEVAQQDLTQPYTLDDLRRDTAARAAMSTQEPVRRFPAATVDVFDVNNNAAQAHNTAVKTPSAAPIFTSDKPSKMDIDNKAIEETQKLSPTAQVTNTSAHVLVIKSNLNKEMSEHSHGNKYSTHVGTSNSNQFFLAGYKSGQMGSGSQLLLAENDGDIVNIVGYMPFGGMESGEGSARRVIGDVSLIKKLDVPISFSLKEFGAKKPNVPQVIAPQSTNSGFDTPAETRMRLWKLVHEKLGWPVGDKKQ
jgi:hypothetical protein